MSASGTAVCWGIPVAQAFLHRLLFLVLGPTLRPLPLHMSSQPLGCGHALAFVKRKKKLSLHLFCLFIVIAKETASLSQF